MAPISGKYTTPKESMNTQKVTNASNVISQSEPSSPKLIIVDEKMGTDVSILSGAIGASVAPEKRIRNNKRNRKSSATSPLSKDPIPNKDINRLFTKNYQKLPPH